MLAGDATHRPQKRSVVLQNATFVDAILQVAPERMNGGESIGVEL